MNTDYVSLETAKLLKEVGFKESDSKVLAKPIWVEEDISPIYSPHLYDAQKWLREAHRIHIEIPYDDTEFYYYILNINKPHPRKIWGDDFATYEQALDAAIQEACDLIKKISNMTKSVLSIEQMQTLIDKGVDVSGASMCWWMPQGDDIDSPDLHIRGINDQFVKNIPTFDLQSILQLLPTFIRWNDLLYDLHSDCKYFIGYSIDWEDAADEYVNGDELYLVDKSGDNMIEAAYQMLLWCIENNHIKTKQQ